MIRTRQQNVTAAQWSSNGDAMGRADLTEPENNPFAANVFSKAVQQERLSGKTFDKLQESLESDEPLDPELADEVAAAMKEWALEKRRHPLHAHVPAAHRARPPRSTTPSSPPTRTAAPRSPSSAARS